MTAREEKLEALVVELSLEVKDLKKSKVDIGNIMAGWEEDLSKIKAYDGEHVSAAIKKLFAEVHCMAVVYQNTK